MTGGLTGKTAAPIWVSVMLLALTAPAAGQTPAGPQPPAESNRSVAFSIGGAGILSVFSSGGAIRGMVAIPISERTSVDIFGGAYRGTLSGVILEEDILAFYGAQVTRRIDRGRRIGFEKFLTFGAEGLVTRDRNFFYPCASPGCTVSHTEVHVSPPVIGLVGFGVQKTLSPRLALRIEAQAIVAIFIPAGVRAGVSLTIPFGQRYQMATRR